MLFIAWVLIGLIMGFIAAKTLGQKSEALSTYLFLGVVGSMAGGFVAELVGLQAKTGTVFWGLLLATAGATALLATFHATRRLGWTDS
jgi:uncharacterized membrane protein YeaQ/YmgE (transglycosylase-associated protein family)